MTFAEPLFLCASDGFPAPCGPYTQWCTDIPRYACIDTMHARRNFAADGACGWELVECPNGCTTETFDGGGGIFSSVSTCR